LRQRLEELAESDSQLARIWDREHDQHVLQQLLHVAETHFRSRSWEAFRRIMIEARKPTDVAGELGMSVNAVLIAKSRVLSYLRRQARGLVD